MSRLVLKYGSEATSNAGNAALRDGVEGRRKLVIGAGAQHDQLLTDRPRRRFDVRELLGGGRKRRIDEDAHAADGTHDLAQQAQPLGLQHRTQVADTGQVAARTAEAGDQARRDRISAERSHDRDR